MADYSKYKYYKGEDENPYGNFKLYSDKFTDEEVWLNLRSLFWHFENTVARGFSTPGQKKGFLGKVSAAYAPENVDVFDSFERVLLVKK